MVDDDDVLGAIQPRGSGPEPIARLRVDDAHGRDVGDRLQPAHRQQMLVVCEEARDERVDAARHHDVRRQPGPLDAPKLGQRDRACARTAKVTSRAQA
jgi:hypothetical protein